MAGLRVTLLGGVGVQFDSGQTVPLQGRKAQALLAYLALQRGHAQPRDKLAALLWPEAPHERARHNLRQLLLVIRQAIPPTSLKETGEAVALDAAGLDVDVTEFERLAVSDTPDALAQATILYQGDLLAGIGQQSAAFEEWLLSERERLRELALEAFAKLLSHHLQAGAAEPAIHTAVRLLALDPAQEPVHRALMRLYVGQGRRSAALKQYQLCVAMLQRELGTEPEAETKQLYREILQQRGPSPAGAGAPAVRPAGRPGGESGPPQPELPSHDTPLIGRASELARLHGALADTWNGRGQVVVVVGEAGVGKTRLVEELAADALKRGGRALVGRCYESTQILAFGPWVDALRSGRIVFDTEVLGALAPVWRAELTRLLPEVAGDDLPAPSDDYLRLFESVAHLVEKLISARPVVLILEDLHWADEMSLRLLAFLARRTPALPVALVTTAREEELADAPALRLALRELDRAVRVVRVKVPPLSRPDTTSLVRALARPGGDADAATRLEEQIWTTSEGNPFIVVESMRALEEGGDRARGPAATLPLPERVREVVAGRLERLSPGSHKLAAVAAVIGCEFEFGLLQRAAELTDREAADGVEELVRRRILCSAREGFDFTHDRIREVVYSQLLPPRRKLLHGRVTSALEALYAGDLEPHYAVLGRHHWEAEIWDKALTYLRQAGSQAAARSAHGQAVTHFERALEALQHLPQSRETLAQAVDVRFELRTSLVALGAFDRVLRYLREAEAMATTLEDERRRGWVSVYMAHYFLMTGDMAEARTSAEIASTVAHALDDFPLRVGATHYFGWTRLDSADHQSAERCFRSVLDWLGGDQVHHRYGLTGFPAVMARWLLATSLADRGEFSEALVHAHEAIRIAEALDHAFSLILAYWAQAYVAGMKGEFTEASRLLERALAVSRDRDILFLSPLTMARLGIAYARSGCVAEGLPLIDQAVSTSDESPIGCFTTMLVAYLGESYLLAGKPQDALRSAERALALARSRGDRGFVAWVLRLLGEIALHSGRPDGQEAEALFREAMALAEELGLRPLVAHCHLGLGELYGKVGRSEPARAELASAIELYRSMAMASWHRRAEEARAE